MRELAFWKAVVADKVDFLESLIALLAEHRIRYCVIGGVAVNAYVAPVVTEDIDLVVAADQLEIAGALLQKHFTPAIPAQRRCLDDRLKSPGADSNRSGL